MKLTFPYKNWATAATSLALLSALAAGADDWPQWRGVNRDGQWREKGLIQKFAGPELPIKWRVPIGSGYSGPTVASGRVYITDRVSEPQQLERVHCFDAKSGEKIWSHSYEAAYGGVGYPAGPRASVTLDEGRAYAIGALGHTYCFDAARGKVLWNRDLGRDYEVNLPTWGITAAPLIEKDLVILHIGGKDACVVGLDKKTGQERWKALGDPASYSAPVVIDQAGKRVLVVWTADRVVGMDPQSGKEYWAAPFPRKRWPIGVSTPVHSGEHLFVTSAIDGSLMLRVPADKLTVEQVWARRGPNDRVTDALHSLISTPLIVGDHVYGICYQGELRCLDAKTGDRLWENTHVVPVAKWAAAHLVQNGDRVWIFNEKGELIISRLSPKGYEELSRAKLLKPTLAQLRERGGVCWSHPAFANQHIFARNDEELVCASLKAP